MSTTQDLANYYADLLILQYVGKPRAYATIQETATPLIIPQDTIQEVSLSNVAVSGTFEFTYGGQTTAAINWNDPVLTIQTKLQALTGLSSVTVTGSIASQLLTVTFTGVPPIALPLNVTANSLLASGSVPITFSVEETDVTLPLAVQDGFNLIGAFTAVGVQLNVLGKYAGVTRTGYVSNQQIILDDLNFLTLIRFAITTNSAGSSLYTIQLLLNEFFPGEVLVFDFKNMQMSYLISSSIGSQDLIKLVVSENLLPKPMGVQLALVIYAPVITTFFGFRTYSLPGFNNSPFNDYASYQTDRPWLSYKNAIIV